MNKMVQNNNALRRLFDSVSIDKKMEDNATKSTSPSRDFNAMLQNKQALSKRGNATGSEASPSALKLNLQAVDATNQQSKAIQGYSGDGYWALSDKGQGVTTSLSSSESSTFMIALRYGLSSGSASAVLKIRDSSGMLVSTQMLELSQTGSDWSHLVTNIALEKAGKYKVSIELDSTSNKNGVVRLDHARVAKKRFSGQLDASMIRVMNRFQNMAVQKPEELKTIFKAAFGDKLTDSGLADLMEKAAGGQLPVPNELVLASSDTLKGNVGAYASKNATIYLEQSLIQDLVSSSEINNLDAKNRLDAVLMEEIVHYIDDAVIGGHDAKGDEGEIVVKSMFQGKALSPEQLRELQTQNDQGDITLAGEVLGAEFRSSDGQTSPYTANLVNMQVQHRMIGEHEGRHRVVLTMSKPVTWQDGISAPVYLPSITVGGLKFYFDEASSEGHKLVFHSNQDTDFAESNVQTNRIEQQDLKGKFLVAGGPATLNLDTAGLQARPVERLASNAATVTESTIREVTHNGQKAVRLDVYYNSAIDFEKAGITEGVDLSVDLVFKKAGSDGVSKKALIDLSKSTDSVLSFFYSFEDGVSGNVIIDDGISVNMPDGAAILPANQFGYRELELTGLWNDADVVIDWEKPTLTGVSVHPEVGGTYEVGQAINVSLDFDEPLRLQGGDRSATVALRVGTRMVEMTSTGLSADGRSLNFQYTIRDDLFDMDGAELLVDSLSFANGASLTDANGKNQFDVNEVSENLLRPHLDGVKVNNIQSFFISRTVSSYSGAPAPFSAEQLALVEKSSTGIVKAATFVLQREGSDLSIARDFVLSGSKIIYHGDPESLVAAYDRGDKLIVNLPITDAHGNRSIVTKRLYLQLIDEATEPKVWAPKQAQINVSANRLSQIGARLGYVGAATNNLGNPITLQVYEAGSKTPSDHFRVNSDGYIEVIKPYRSVASNSSGISFVDLENVDLYLAADTGEIFLDHQRVTLATNGWLTRTDDDQYFVTQDGGLYHNVQDGQGETRAVKIGDTGVAGVIDIARDEYGRLWALTGSTLVLINLGNAASEGLVALSKQARQFSVTADGSLVLLDVAGAEFSPKGLYGFKVANDPTTPTFYYDPNSDGIGAKNRKLVGTTIPGVAVDSVVTNFYVEIENSAGEYRDITSQFQIVEGKLTFASDDARPLERARIAGERLNVQVVHHASGGGAEINTPITFQLARDSAPELHISSDKSITVFRNQLSTAGSKLQFIGVGSDSDFADQSTTRTKIYEGDSHTESTHFGVTSDGYLVVLNAYDSASSDKVPLNIEIEDGKLLRRYGVELDVASTSPAAFINSSYVAVEKIVTRSASSEAVSRDIKTTANQLHKILSKRIGGYSDSVKEKVENELRSEGITVRLYVADNDSFDMADLPSTFVMRVDEDINDFLNRAVIDYSDRLARQFGGNSEPIAFASWEVTGAITMDRLFQREEHQNRINELINQSRGEFVGLNFRSGEVGVPGKRYTETRYWVSDYPEKHGSYDYDDLKAEARKAMDQVVNEYAGYSDVAQKQIRQIIEDNGGVNFVGRVWEIEKDNDSYSLERNVEIRANNNESLRDYLYRVADNYADQLINYIKVTEDEGLIEIMLTSIDVDLPPIELEDTSVDFPPMILEAFGLAAPIDKGSKLALTKLGQKLASELNQTKGVFTQSKSFYKAAIYTAERRLHVHTSGHLKGTRTEFSKLSTVEQNDILLTITNNEIMPFYRAILVDGYRSQQNLLLALRPKPWAYVAEQLGEYLGIDRKDWSKLATLEIVDTLSAKSHPSATHRNQRVWTPTTFVSWVGFLQQGSLRAKYAEVGVEWGATQNIIRQLKASVNVVDSDKFEANITKLFELIPGSNTEISNGNLPENLVNIKEGFQDSYNEYIRNVEDMYINLDARIRLLKNPGQRLNLPSVKLGRAYEVMSVDEKVAIDSGYRQLTARLRDKEVDYSLNDLTSVEDARLNVTKEYFDELRRVLIPSPVFNAIVDGAEGNWDAFGHDILQGFAMLSTLVPEVGAVMSLALFSVDGAWTVGEAAENYAEALKSQDPRAIRSSLNQLKLAIIGDLSVVAGTGFSSGSGFSGFDGTLEFHESEWVGNVEGEQNGLRAYSTKDGDQFHVSYDPNTTEPPVVSRLELRDGVYKKQPLDELPEGMIFAESATDVTPYELEISDKWEAVDPDTNQPTDVYQVTRTKKLTGEVEVAKYMRKANGSWAKVRYQDGGYRYATGRESVITRSVGEDPALTNSENLQDLPTVPNHEPALQHTQFDEYGLPEVPTFDPEQLELEARFRALKDDKLTSLREALESTESSDIHQLEPEVLGESQASWDEKFKQMENSLDELTTRYLRVRGLLDNGVVSTDAEIENALSQLGDLKKELNEFTDSQLQERLNRLRAVEDNLDNSSPTDVSMTREEYVQAQVDLIDLLNVIDDTSIELKNENIAELEILENRFQKLKNSDSGQRINPDGSAERTRGQLAKNGTRSSLETVPNELLQLTSTLDEFVEEFQAMNSAQKPQEAIVLSNEQLADLYEQVTERAARDLNSEIVGSEGQILPAPKQVAANMKENVQALSQEATPVTDEAILASSIAEKALTTGLPQFYTKYDTEGATDEAPVLLLVPTYERGEAVLHQYKLAMGLGDEYVDLLNSNEARLARRTGEAQVVKTTTGRYVEVSYLSTSKTLAVVELTNSVTEAQRHLATIATGLPEMEDVHANLRSRSATLLSDLKDDALLSGLASFEASVDNLRNSINETIAAGGGEQLVEAEISVGNSEVGSLTHHPISFSAADPIDSFTISVNNTGEGSISGIGFITKQGHGDFFGSRGGQQNSILTRNLKELTVFHSNKTAAIVGISFLHIDGRLSSIGKTEESDSVLANTVQWDNKALQQLNIGINDKSILQTLSVHTATPEMETVRAQTQAVTAAIQNILDDTNQKYAELKLKQAHVSAVTNQFSRLRDVNQNGLVSEYYNRSLQVLSAEKTYLDTEVSLLDKRRTQLNELLTDISVVPGVSAGDGSGGVLASQIRNWLVSFDNTWQESIDVLLSETFQRVRGLISDGQSTPKISADAGPAERLKLLLDAVQLDAIPSASEESISADSISQLTEAILDLENDSPTELYAVPDSAEFAYRVATNQKSLPSQVEYLESTDPMYQSAIAQKARETGLAHFVKDDQGVKWLIVPVIGSLPAAQIELVKFQVESDVDYASWSQAWALDGYDSSTRSEPKSIQLSEFGETYLVVDLPERGVVLVKPSNGLLDRITTERLKLPSPNSPAISFTYQNSEYRLGVHIADSDGVVWTSQDNVAGSLLIRKQPAKAGEQLEHFELIDVRTGEVYQNSEGVPVILVKHSSDAVYQTVSAHNEGLQRGSQSASLILTESGNELYARFSQRDAYGTELWREADTGTGAFKMDGRTFSRGTDNKFQDTNKVGIPTPKLGLTEEPEFTVEPEQFAGSRDLGDGRVLDEIQLDYLDPISTWVIRSDGATIHAIGFETKNGDSASFGGLAGEETRVSLEDLDEVQIHYSENASTRQKIVGMEFRLSGGRIVITGNTSGTIPVSDPITAGGTRSVASTSTTITFDQKTLRNLNVYSNKLGGYVSGMGFSLSEIAYDQQFDASADWKDVQLAVRDTVSPDHHIRWVAADGVAYSSVTNTPNASHLIVELADTNDVVAIQRDATGQWKEVDPLTGQTSTRTVQRALGGYFFRPVDLPVQTFDSAASWDDVTAALALNQSTVEWTAPDGVLYSSDVSVTDSKHRLVTIVSDDGSTHGFALAYIDSGVWAVVDQHSGDLKPGNFLLNDAKGEFTYYYDDASAERYRLINELTSRQTRETGVPQGGWSGEHSFHKDSDWATLSNAIKEANATRQYVTWSAADGREYSSRIYNDATNNNVLIPLPGTGEIVAATHLGGDQWSVVDRATGSADLSKVLTRHSDGSFSNPVDLISQQRRFETAFYGIPSEDEQEALPRNDALLEAAEVAKMAYTAKNSGAAGVAIPEAFSDEGVDYIIAAVEGQTGPQILRKMPGNGDDSDIHYRMIDSTTGNFHISNRSEFDQVGGKVVQLGRQYTTVVSDQNGRLISTATANTAAYQSQRDNISVYTAEGELVQLYRTPFSKNVWYSAAENGYQRTFENSPQGGFFAEITKLGLFGAGTVKPQDVVIEMFAVNTQLSTSWPEAETNYRNQNEGYVAWNSPTHEKYFKAFDFNNMGGQQVGIFDLTEHGIRTYDSDTVTYSFDTPNAYFRIDNDGNIFRTHTEIPAGSKLEYSVNIKVSTGEGSQTHHRTLNLASFDQLNHRLIELQGELVPVRRVAGNFWEKINTVSGKSQHGLATSLIVETEDHSYTVSTNYIDTLWRQAEGTQAKANSGIAEIGYEGDLSDFGKYDTDYKYEKSMASLAADYSEPLDGLLHYKEEITTLGEVAVTPFTNKISVPVVRVGGKSYIQGFGDRLVPIQDFAYLMQVMDRTVNAGRHSGILKDILIDKYGHAFSPVEAALMLLSEASDYYLNSNGEFVKVDRAAPDLKESIVEKNNAQWANFSANVISVPNILKDEKNAYLLANRGGVYLDYNKFENRLILMKGAWRSVTGKAPSGSESAHFVSGPVIAELRGVRSIEPMQHPSVPGAQSPFPLGYLDSGDRRNVTVSVPNDNPMMLRVTLQDGTSHLISIANKSVKMGFGSTIRNADKAAPFGFNSVFSDVDTYNYDGSFISSGSTLGQVPNSRLLTNTLQRLKVAPLVTTPPSTVSISSKVSGYLGNPLIRTFFGEWFSNQTISGQIGNLTQDSLRKILVIYLSSRAGQGLLDLITSSSDGLGGASNVNGTQSVNNTSYLENENNTFLENDDYGNQSFIGRTLLASVMDESAPTPSRSQGLGDARLWGLITSMIVAQQGITQAKDIIAEIPLLNNAGSGHFIRALGNFAEEWTRLTANYVIQANATGVFSRSPFASEVPYLTAAALGISLLRTYQNRVIPSAQFGRQNVVYGGLQLAQVLVDFAWRGALLANTLPGKYPSSLAGIAVRTTTRGPDKLLLPLGHYITSNIKNPNFEALQRQYKDLNPSLLGSRKLYELEQRIESAFGSNVSAPAGRYLTEHWPAILTKRGFAQAIRKQYKRVFTSQPNSETSYGRSLIFAQQRDTEILSVTRDGGALTQTKLDQLFEQLMDGTFLPQGAASDTTGKDYRPGLSWDNNVADGLKEFYSNAGSRAVLSQLAIQASLNLKKYSAGKFAGERSGSLPYAETTFSSSYQRQVAEIHNRLLDLAGLKQELQDQPDAGKILGAIVKYTVESGLFHYKLRYGETGTEFNDSGETGIAFKRPILADGKNLTPRQNELVDGLDVLLANYGFGLAKKHNSITYRGVNALASFVSDDPGNISIFRGVTGRSFATGDVLVNTEVFSTSQSGALASNFSNSIDFLQTQAESRTVLVIRGQTSVNVSQITDQNQAETIFSPGALFEVEKITGEENGDNIGRVVYLRQINTSDWEANYYYHKNGLRAKIKPITDGGSEFMIVEPFTGKAYKVKTNNAGAELKREYFPIGSYFTGRAVDPQDRADQPSVWRRPFDASNSPSGMKDDLYYHYAAGGDTELISTNMSDLTDNIHMTFFREQKIKAAREALEKNLDSSGDVPSAIPPSMVTAVKDRVDEYLSAVEGLKGEGAITINDGDWRNMLASVRTMKNDISSSIADIQEMVSDATQAGRGVTAVQIDGLRKVDELLQKIMDWGDIEEDRITVERSYQESADDALGNIDSFFTKNVSDAAEHDRAQKLFTWQASNTLRRRIQLNELEEGIGGSLHTKELIFDSAEGFDETRLSQSIPIEIGFRHKSDGAKAYYIQSPYTNGQWTEVSITSPKAGELGGVVNEARTLLYAVAAELKPDDYFPIDDDIHTIDPDKNLIDQYNEIVSGMGRLADWKYDRYRVALSNAYDSIVRDSSYNGEIFKPSVGYNRTGSLQSGKPNVLEFASDEKGAEAGFAELSRERVQQHFNIEVGLDSLYSRPSDAVVYYKQRVSRGNGDESQSVVRYVPVSMVASETVKERRLLAANVSYNVLNKEFVFRNMAASTTDNDRYFVARYQSKTRVGGKESEIDIDWSQRRFKPIDRASMERQRADLTSDLKIYTDKNFGLYLQQTQGADDVFIPVRVVDIPQNWGGGGISGIQRNDTLVYQSLEDPEKSYFWTSSMRSPGLPVSGQFEGFVTDVRVSRSGDVLHYTIVKARDRHESLQEALSNKNLQENMYRYSIGAGESVGTWTLVLPKPSATSVLREPPEVAVTSRSRSFFRDYQDASSGVVETVSRGSVLYVNKAVADGVESERLKINKDVLGRSGQSSSYAPSAVFAYKEGEIYSLEGTVNVNGREFFAYRGLTESSYELFSPTTLGLAKVIRISGNEDQKVELKLGDGTELALSPRGVELSQGQDSGIGARLVNTDRDALDLIIVGNIDEIPGPNERGTLITPYSHFDSQRPLVFATENNDSVWVWDRENGVLKGKPRSANTAAVLTAYKVTDDQMVYFDPTRSSWTLKNVHNGAFGERASFNQFDLDLIEIDDGDPGTLNLYRFSHRGQVVNNIGASGQLIDATDRNRVRTFWPSFDRDYSELLDNGAIPAAINTRSEVNQVLNIDNEVDTLAVALFRLLRVNEGEGYNIEIADDGDARWYEEHLENINAIRRSLEVKGIRQRRQLVNSAVLKEFIDSIVAVGAPSGYQTPVVVAHIENVQGQVKLYGKTDQAINLVVDTNGAVKVLRSSPENYTVENLDVEHGRLLGNVSVGDALIIEGSELSLNLPRAVVSNVVVSEGEIRHDVQQDKWLYRSEQESEGVVRVWYDLTLDGNTYYRTALISVTSESGEATGSSRTTTLPAGAGSGRTRSGQNPQQDRTHININPYLVARFDDSEDIEATLSGLPTGTTISFGSGRAVLMSESVSDELDISDYRDQIDEVFITLPQETPSTDVVFKISGINLEGVQESIETVVGR